MCSLAMIFVSKAWSHTNDRDKMKDITPGLKIMWKFFTTIFTYMGGYVLLMLTSFFISRYSIDFEHPDAQGSFIVRFFEFIGCVLLYPMILLSSYMNKLAVLFFNALIWALALYAIVYVICRAKAKMGKKQ